MTGGRTGRLLRDSRAVSTVEFALVAPVLLLTLFGIFDLGYTSYIDSQLQGAIQKAARDSTIEGASDKEAELDAAVTNAVHIIVPQATLAFSRQSYSSFSDVAQPEEFTDSPPKNGVCDGGEPFEDANGNGVWDSDRGANGFGSARDAVLYNVEVTYVRPFPVAAFLGQNSSYTLKAATVLRNQPFGQQVIAATVGNCP